MDILQYKGKITFQDREWNKTSVDKIRELRQVALMAFKSQEQMNEMPDKDTGEDVSTEWTAKKMTPTPHNCQRTSKQRKNNPRKTTKRKTRLRKKDKKADYLYLEVHVSEGWGRRIVSSRCNYIGGGVCGENCWYPCWKGVWINWRQTNLVHNKIICCLVCSHVLFNCPYVLSNWLFNTYMVCIQGNMLPNFW